MKQKAEISIPFMLLGILFNICLVTANLLETKVVQIAGITATAGLIVFPVSYIINDCISEVWGFKKARLIIWSGFISNFIVIIFGKIAISLPSAPFWEGETAFNFVFGLAPRIALASLFAFLVGSFLNAYVMSKMKLYHKGKHFSLRAVVSTIIGETSDSIIFFLIAFAGLIPMNEIFTLIITQASLKSLYEIIILPVTVYFVKYVKKVDNCDTFDKNISYKVWKIKDI